MCAGGGSMPRATITVPNYRAFDRQLDRQIEVMEGRFQNRAINRQEKLGRAVGKQQKRLDQLLDLSMEQANNTAAEAQRIAALVGTPPPSPTAKAPVLGANRTGQRRAEGKAALRIDPAGPAANTSLNIGY
jgi:hypothetical protein